MTDFSGYKKPIDDLFQAVLSPRDSLPIHIVSLHELFPSLIDASVLFEPFQLPIISLPPETDSDAPVTREAPAIDAADHARDQFGYNGVRATLAFFQDEVKKIYLRSGIVPAYILC